MIPNMPAWQLPAGSSATQVKVMNEPSQEIVKKHSEMAIRLAKSGQDILESLTPEDCDMTHMFGCVMGEAAELFEAFDEPGHTRNEIIEELGDFEFYMAKVRDILKINRHNKTGEKYLGSTKEHLIQIMILSGHLWDVAKKVVIYRQKIDEHRALLIVNEIEAHLNSIYSAMNYDIEEVLEANYAKLEQRYGSKYSDKAAQQRKDKKPYKKSGKVKTELPISEAGS